MSLPLRVLGDRVLVRPDVSANAPETLASGVVVAKSLAAAVTGEDASTSVHRGTVVAVGNPRHPLSHEADTLAAKVHAVIRSTLDDDGVIEDAAHLLRDLVRRHPCVAVGDDVLFSPDAGQEMIIDGDVLIILHESDLLAVVEPESNDYVFPGDWSATTVANARRMTEGTENG
jgi:co-chaperonin GroES (HSP10)